MTFTCSEFDSVDDLRELGLDDIATTLGPRFSPESNDRRGEYTGHLCPECGRSFRADSEAIRIDGECGTVGDLSSLGKPDAMFCPPCYARIVQAVRKELNKTLDEYSGGEGVAH